MQLSIVSIYWLSQKGVYAFGGLWNLPIFKTKVLTYQSTANLDENILFGKIAHLQDPKISKMLVRCCMGAENSMLHSGL